MTDDPSFSNAAGSANIRARQLAAVHGLAKIPFASVRDEAPMGMQELYAEVRDGQALIPGLKMGVGALIVQRWDPSYAAAGWALYGADLTLDMGHPFGALFYRNDADGRVLRVGVKWHPPVQQLEFPALHPSKPELSSDCSDERPTRSSLTLEAGLEHSSPPTRRSGRSSRPKNLRTRSSKRPALAWNV